MPLPPVPVQGDRKALAPLKSGIKMQNGTSGPLVQSAPVGRPQGSTVPSSGGLPPVQPEHKSMMDELARKEWVRQQWTQMAQQSPTPWVMGMKNLADQQASTAEQAVYNIIPNVEP